MHICSICDQALSSVLSFFLERAKAYEQANVPQVNALVSDCAALVVETLECLKNARVEDAIFWSHFQKRRKVHASIALGRIVLVEAAEVSWHI